MARRTLWGTLSAAAITIALTAGCSAGTSAGTASSNDDATPAAGTTSSPEPGSGSPDDGNGNGPGKTTGTSTENGTGNGTGTGRGSDGGDGDGSGSGTGTGAGAGTERQRCTTGTLSARLANSNAVETNRYVTVVLTNTSGAPCTIRGWSGLRLARGAGPLPTRVMRHGTPQTVTIPAGGYAYERLHWSSELADDETVPCQPAATLLKVTPPDHTRRLTTFWNNGPVCRHGEIWLTPITAGPSR